MRKTYMAIMKEVLYEDLTAYMIRTKCTIAALATILCIDTRSCADICRGKSTFSALSLIRYLIYCCDDVVALLDEMKRRFEEADKGNESDVA